METTTRRPCERPASPERWQLALDRAARAGMHVHRDSTSGRCEFWVATSPATKPIMLMVLDGEPFACDCVAYAYGDRVCLHRAAWFAATGRLADIGLAQAPARPAVKHAA